MFDRQICAQIEILIASLYNRINQIGLNDDRINDQTIICSYTYTTLN